jgi:hypothetical protein
MNYIRNTTLFCALVSLLSGCATEQNYAIAVHSWRGGDQNALYRVWGYPNSIETLPNGHPLLIYKQSQHGVNPVYSNPGNTTIVNNPNGTTYIASTPTTISGGGSYDYHCTTWFELDKKGTIVGTNFRGNNCVANQSFLRQYSA